MSSVFSTLLFQHDLALVALAAAICAVSSFAGIALMDRARHGSGRRKLVWIGVAALAVGFGIWSTHFIAMLAYMPGFAVGYRPLGTLLSLVIAIVCSGLGFAMVAYGKRRSDQLLGGLVVGIGITAMHYTGMGALDLGGAIGWDMGLVNLSLLLACGLAACAVMLGVARSSLRNRLGASALLTASIVSLHFTGMGAADLSNCFAVVDDAALNTGRMATVLGLGSAVILGSALLALALDTLDARRRRLEAMRLHSLADAAAEGLVILDGLEIAGANSSFSALVGVDREVLTGMQVDRFFEPGVITKARAAGDRFCTTMLTDADGHEVAVEFTSRQAELENGPTEVLSVRDIRARLEQEAENERARTAARQSEMRYGLLVQSVTDYAIYMLDPDGKVGSWNAGAERNKGYTAEEIIGHFFGRFFSAEDQAERLPERALEAARLTGKYQTEGWRYRKDGSRFWAQVMIEAIRTETGDLLGYVKITRDITRQHEDAERIAAGQRNLELSLANMSQGLALFGADERIVVANRRLNEILSIPQQLSIEGLSLHDLAKFLGDAEADPRVIDAVYHTHKRLIAGEQHGEMLQDLRGNRTIRIVHRPAGDGAFVSTFEDVTERKQSERKILYMAHHDGLTGLPNRGSFSHHLEQAIERADGDRVAVLVIDLDRFKEINDQLGHQTGDAVLKHYAESIARDLEPGELVSRFGGDEFAAFKTFRSDADLFGFIQRLEAAVAERFVVERNQVSIAASIGVAIYPTDASTAEKLISNADMAMYRAKPSLSQRVCFYEPEMDEAARDRRLMARDLWDAIELNQLSLNYQVQKSVQTGAVTGYEALLRWDHPTRGRVPPLEFIEVAEECGAILPIGEWVLEQAAQDAAGWGSGVKLAVNISPVQLGSAALVEVVRRVLEDTGLAPERLELEVTESAIIADKARALLMLQQIKEIGVTIAIDDFGTGYSSLETLRSFPFDKIKLDRSFMSEVETSRQAKAVVRAILELGR